MVKTWRWIAPLAMAGGLVAAAGVIPAEAASTASISIHAKNPGFPSVNHDTIVFYGLKGIQNATVSGTVSGATAGDVVTLLARPFKAAHYTAAGKPLTLTSASQSYSFSVRPTLATSYRAQVTSGSAVVATSAVQSVYVGLQQIVQTRYVHYKCNRADTECNLIIPTKTIVPASAYRSESAKRWFFYLAVNYSSGAPSGRPPKFLSIYKDASASKAARVSATDFAITFTFRIATHGKNFIPFPNACTKDTVTKDGVGLPGRPLCGNARVRSAADYLG
jgi:hypothetical protein